LDPEKRMSLEEVQQHPWITKYCVTGERATVRSSASTKSSGSSGSSQ
jgi:aurora kinase